MGIFNRKIDVGQEVQHTTESNVSDVNFNEKPRICCVDIEQNIVDLLIKDGYNIYIATLGDRILMPNKIRKDNHQVLLNFDFPENIHEFDIFLIDLHNSKLREYDPKDHLRGEYTGKSAVSLLSSYPETVFDPRPISSMFLHNKLGEIGNRNHMVVTFTTGNYEIEYEKVKITETYVERQGTEEHGIYSFSRSVPLSKPKCGVEMNVCEIREDLANLLSTLKGKSSYNQTFYHPTVWENGKNEPDKNYVPLIKNSSGDIVAICEQTNNSIHFFYPQMEQKYDFISSFLKDIAPSISPELFPFSTTFNWKNNREYWLPNHEKLTIEEQRIVVEYEDKLIKKNEEIQKNKNKYSFLHELISATGDELVNAAIEFLKWLEFRNIINPDDLKADGQLLEEDIQIEFENGLIIIECKGIGGTSTDSNCSQISKIKHRRCKERNKFDVFALYLVNHQRYLPPLQRSHPPFNKRQIQDALNDERGLLSTWQLFNLYYEIENGIITKEEARKEIIKFGLIEFRPSNITFIDEPKELLKNGEVCIINIEDLELKVGDQILAEKNDQFIEIAIEGIQVNGKPVQKCSTGELGIKLSSPIKKKSKLWKKTIS